MFKLEYAFNPRATIGFTSTAYANHDHGFGMTMDVDPNDPTNFINIPTALRSNGQHADLRGGWKFRADADYNSAGASLFLDL